MAEQRQAGGRRDRRDRGAQARRRTDLLTQGSATLVRSLLAAGLVDELFLLVYPVLLGRGKRWFGEDAMPGEWTLADTRSSTTGVLISRYRPRGPVRTGSFAGGEPSEAELARREKWKKEG